MKHPLTQGCPDPVDSDHLTFRPARRVRRFRSACLPAAGRRKRRKACRGGTAALPLNLLGSDLTVTNFGGGNTSAKILERDPLTGESVRVLWVKGSGGDIGSMKLDGFSTLYLDKLLRLEKLYRGIEHEDEMVGYLPHCTFNLESACRVHRYAAAAYLPSARRSCAPRFHHRARCAPAVARRPPREIWGGRWAGWRWQRPGFELGLRLRDYVASNPGLRARGAGGARRDRLGRHVAGRAMTTPSI